MPAVFAAEEYYSDPAGFDNNFILDETGTLTVAQIKSLNQKAAGLLEKRDCAVYIWLVDLVPEEYAKTIDDVEEYVIKYFDKYNLGFGEDRNGMVLLLEIGDVPGERDYLFYTRGSCKNIFNNSVREAILDESIVPLFIAAFNNGNFYKVADVFLDEVENKFASDIITTLALKLACVIVIPVALAFFVCSGWKSKMKTARIARTADNYIPKDSFKLTGQTDQFLYRTTTRVKIERESSSSGGSSSSSSGSSSGGKV